MSLLKYKKKRNFSNTPEPNDEKKAKGKDLVFVIQRHKASHLHYDFRLELDGVLKSWAVPKGPSMNPNDKRLAMMVEDHPYNYRKFKGIIPEGNYGAGIVEIWDEGVYYPIDEEKLISDTEFKSNLKKGSIKFIINGKKLKGEFALVKMKAEQENAWLLIKHNDEFAIHEEYNSEELTPKDSPINKELKKSSKKPAPKK